MATIDDWLRREQTIVTSKLPAFAGDADISMLRLDVLHPIVSGNKWFKLKYHLLTALETGHKGVLTFGGAYSNHLIATAAAAESYGLKSVGMVRGLHAAEKRTPVLEQCQAMGMELHFLSREAYALKEEPAQLQALAASYPELLVIPEGGATESGRRGAAEIARYIATYYDIVCVSVGTATTFAGLRQALPAETQVLGFAPMKGGIYLADHMTQWCGDSQHGNWSLTDAFHFGGFGKINEELRLFMADFKQRYGFGLDRVYTAKMMYGVQALIASGHISGKARILCIHTGGLSGN